MDGVNESDFIEEIQGPNLLITSIELPDPILVYGERAALIEKTKNWDDFEAVIDTFKTKIWYKLVISEFFDWCVH